MTRNEILTLICLVLLLATDTALIAAALYMRNQVQNIKDTLRRLPVVGSLI